MTRPPTRSPSWSCFLQVRRSTSRTDREVATRMLWSAKADAYDPAKVPAGPRALPGASPVASAPGRHAGWTCSTPTRRRSIVTPHSAEMSGHATPLPAVIDRTGRAAGRPAGAPLHEGLVVRLLAAFLVLSLSSIAVVSIVMSGD